MKIFLTFEKGKDNSLTLFSIPQTNSYQEVNNLIIKPKTYEVITEKIWGNKVLIFKNKNLEQNPQIIFSFQPKIFKKQISKSYLLSDYKKQKLKIINNYFINGNDAQIKRLALNIKKKENNLGKIFRSFYDFILNYLTYGNPIDDLYSYKEALTKRVTDCGGFSTLLGSLLQVLEIPTRLVVGFLIKKDIISKVKSLYFQRTTFAQLSIHAWLEAQLPDESWFPIDASIEWRRKKGLTKREGGFGYIPDDRLVVSWGCDFFIKDKYRINILQKPQHIEFGLYDSKKKQALNILKRKLD